MTIQLAAYADAGMTTPLASLSFAQAADGSSSGSDRVFYIGTPVSGNVYQSSAAPGTGQISVEITDAAGGLLASSVKLALSSGGLDSAQPGGSLDIGTSITGGSGHAVAIHVRVDSPAMSPGVYNDLGLLVGPVIEVPA